MASVLRKLFRRKKQPPLVCSVTLDDHGNLLADDPNHVHTGACFMDFEPLALIELFQSQGCAACPPAVTGIQAAASNPNRLLLTYNVTLFDHTGWKDTFARNSWDQRQRSYLQRWQRKSLYTPHVVVNGIIDTSGANGASDLDNAVSEARNAVRGIMPWHILIDANDTEVHIDSDAPSPSAANMQFPLAEAMATNGGDGMDQWTNTQAQAPPFVPVHDVMLAVYQAGDQTVKIGKGPNKGKKLVHRNVVTNLVKIGEWNGGDLTLSLPSARSAMVHGHEAVAFVQAGSGGPIVAATKI